jgi:3-dehydroquinate dehydratase II
VSYSILILNGPNLNLLGTREPSIYGAATLQDIEQACTAKANALKLTCTCFQSNMEGELIERIQKAAKTQHAIIINAGAYTHTSVAIRDALIAVNLPVIEVHISNIFKREEFRHHSYISDIATGLICGLGTQGYTLAVEAVANLLAKK